MPNTPSPFQPEVLSVGELLIDFISTDYVDSFEEAQGFRPIPGGSPANMGSNLHRLGQRVGLVASVGSDDMGRYLVRFVEGLGMDMQGVRQVEVPTTLILVTKSRTVSNFEAYRMADCQITAEQLPTTVLDGLKILHTTCFALSLEPARSSILAAAQYVAARGGRVSIDANYAQKIWPDTAEAQTVVAEYCALGAMVKISEVDWERLYGHPLIDNAAAAAHLHGLGAALVCITLGDKGCYVSWDGEQHFVPSRPVDVKDTTGAGDAFWSGFLCAYLDGHPLLHCALAGRKMAELKLQVFGPLPKNIDKNNIYVDF